MKKDNQNHRKAVEEGLQDYESEQNYAFQDEMMVEVDGRKVGSIRELLGALIVSPDDKKLQHAKTKLEIAMFYRERARMVSRAIGLIKKNPHLSEEEFVGWFNHYLKEIHFPIDANFFVRVNEIFTKYKSIQNKVRWLLEDNLKATDLFYGAFGFLPNGKVEIRDGLASLHFDCHDHGDFLRMYNLVCYGKCDEDIQDNQNTSAVIGFKNKWDIDGFHVIVTATDCSPLGTHDREATFTHEQQHALMDVFNEGLVGLDPYDPKILWHQLLGLDEKPAALDQAIRRFMKKSDQIGGRVKDEILAYVKEGRSTDNLFHLLNKKKKDGGLYDYAEEYLNDPESLMLDLLGGNRLYVDDIYDHYKDQFQKSAEKVFRDEYEGFLNEALDVVDELRSRDYSDEEIVALLIAEPIARWKVVSKLV